MTEQLLGLTLAYVFLTALTLLAVISGRLPWPLKTVLVIVAIGFYWSCYIGWKEAQGWPSETNLPAKFLFHYAVIEEPNEERNEEGDIYIWLTNLEGNQMAEKPRAYRLPYDQAGHAAIEEALIEVLNSGPQLGFFGNRMDVGEKAKDKSAFGQKTYELEFAPVPDPALPEK